MRYVLLLLYRLFIVLCHVAMVVVALAFAFWLRFDFTLPATEQIHLLMAIWIAVPVKTATFVVARFHRGWWRLVSTTDLVRLILGNAVASGAFTLLTWKIIGPAFSRSVYVLDFLMCF